MTTPLDDFDPERSRAAVAVACLRWLHCTGPASEPATAPARARITPPDVARLLLENVPDPSPLDFSPISHPLWDRWLDG